MPLLTGKRAEHEQDDMPAELPDVQGKKCDILPLIWREFAQKGYATTFNEGNSGLGTFHYRRGGFQRQPTTFFYRNFWRMVDKVRKRKDDPEYCLGDQKIFQMHLDLTMRHLKVLQNISTFSVHYLVDPTHENIELTGTLDFGYRKMFQEMFEQGYLNRSAVLFFGDHGHRLFCTNKFWFQREYFRKRYQNNFRFSTILQTRQGQIESWNPFFGIWFPRWFLNKYPWIEHNLAVNRNRLSTFFDAYETLNDILNRNFGNYVSSSLEENHTKRGISMLQELPEKRSCRQAGIPDRFCICDASNLIDTNQSIVWDGAKFAVQYMNDLFKTAKFGS